MESGTGSGTSVVSLVSGLSSTGGSLPANAGGFPTSRAEPEGPITASSGFGGRGRIWVVVAAVLLVVVAGFGAYLVTNDVLHPKGTSGVILIPKGKWFSIPGDQYNDVAFVAGQSSILNGTITNSGGLNLYLMTPAELLSLSKTGQVGGSTWASGRIANLTVTHLNLPVSAGSWDLVFLNSDGPVPPTYLGNSPLNTTIVGFWTDLTLSPG